VSGLLAELHQDAIGTAEIGSGSGRFLPDRRNAASDHHLRDRPVPRLKSTASQERLSSSSAVEIGNHYFRASGCAGQALFAALTEPIVSALRATILRARSPDSLRLTLRI
jgi:hypothetical protein